MKRPLILYLLIALHLFLGTGGVAGGILFILSPDGSLLGMGAEWLVNSPFNNYFLPGIILLIFNGILPFITIFGLIKKTDLRLPDVLNIYGDRNWAWTYSLYSGIILIFWITVQLIMTHYFWLQPVMIFIGLLIIICTMTPPIMKEYEKDLKNQEDKIPS